MVPEDRRGWSLAWRRGVAAGLFRPLCSSLISSRFVGERPGSKRTLTCARVTSTLIDLFAEVVRSPIQELSGRLCRQEEGRVGKEGGSQRGSRWVQDTDKK